MAFLVTSRSARGPLSPERQFLRATPRRPWGLLCTRLVSLPQLTALFCSRERVGVERTIWHVGFTTIPGVLRDPILPLIALPYPRNWRSRSFLVTSRAHSQERTAGSEDSWNWPRAGPSCSTKLESLPSPCSPSS